MVKISKPARNDLKQIYKYIARDSSYYAREVIQSIIQQIKKLEKFPNIGRMVPEQHDQNIREIIHNSYRIVYRINGMVEIATIIHAKRNFNEAIEDRI